MIQCKAQANPFYYGRLEHEHGPTLFAPESIIEWAGRKPILFEGVRGSGKSSVLKLLTWDVAWKVSPVKITGSPDVRKFLGKQKHIGIYYRVEDIDVPLWDRWQVSEDTAQRYFGTYLDFLYLYLLLDALIGIRKKTKLLFTDRSAEKELTGSLLRECFPDKNRPRLLNMSFISLREIVADVHQSIRHLVFQDVSERDIKETYSVVGPGCLLKKFGSLFKKCYPNMADCVILILLDDCNFLTKWQAVILNTAVVNCTVPISYKLSTLAGLYPTVDTMDKQRPVILDNIDPEPLPTQSSFFVANKARKGRGMQYATFVNEICKARIEENFGKTYADQFNFRKHLGPFDLERLLAQKLKSSESDKALVLLSKANEAKIPNKQPPITGTWLAQKGIREYEIENGVTKEDFKRKTRQISSVYKKKWNHVAGIALCKEFGLDFPYCSYKVILDLSSDSIREMLRIMSMIWEEIGNDIQNFLRQQPITEKIQTRGIQKASEARFEFIDSNVISEPGATLQRVCARLGSLFSKCQSFPYILTTPETASIAIESSKLDDDISEIVRKGVVSGWFLTKIDDKKTIIGLHPILAPKFNLSFRNPFYYPEPISDKNQIGFLFLGSDSDARRIEKVILDQRMRRYSNRHKPNQKLNRLTSQKQNYLFNINPD